MLLSHSDLQPALNIDLTDPNGQELADALIEATQALISGSNYLGFPVEEAEVTEYRSDDTFPTSGSRSTDTPTCSMKS